MIRKVLTITLVLMAGVLPSCEYDCPFTAQGIARVTTLWVEDYVRHDGDSDTYFGFDATDAYTLKVANTERIDVGAMTTTITAANGPVLISQTNAYDAFRVDDQANDTTPFVIDQSGNVGVGTTEPDAKLTIYDSGTNGIHLNASSYPVMRFQTAGVNKWGVMGNLNLANDLSIYNYTANNTLIELTSGGNVGIGTADPGSKLTVAGPLALQPPSVITTAYSMVATDASLIFSGTTTITLTLQAASSYPGRVLNVKTIVNQAVNSGSSNVVPLASYTAGDSILAATAGKWAMLQSDGTNWVIMAAN
jgi:hypothetical protein